MTSKLCSFIRVYVIINIDQTTLFVPVNYVNHTGRRFTVSNEMKTSAQGFIVGFIFTFNRANGKPQRLVSAKSGHLFFGYGRIH